MTGGLIQLITSLAIICLIAWGTWYLTTNLPVPDPLGRIVRVLVMVICVVAAVLVLLKFAGILLV